MLESRKYVIFILISMTFLSCRTNKLENSIFQLEPIHDFKTAPLIGVIYSTDNVPCPEATISIYSDDETATKLQPVQKVVSDINGRFMVPEVQKGRHEIIITKEGFEEGKITFDFLDMTKVFYIQMKSLESLLDDAEKSLDKRELQDAEVYIERALAIDDKSLEALYLKAVVLTLLGKSKESNEIFNRILEIDPDFIINK